MSFKEAKLPTKISIILKSTFFYREQGDEGLTIRLCNIYLFR